MDYILEMDILNESAQFDMRNTIIESFELEAIREGFSRKSLANFFRKAVEMVTGWANTLKAWATKIFGPIINKYKKYRAANLNKAYQSGKMIKVNCPYYEVKVKVFNAALAEGNNNQKNIFEGIKYIESNIDKFLYKKMNVNLGDERIWKMIKTDKSQLPAPLNKASKIEDFMTKYNFGYVDKELVNLILQNQKNLDIMSKSIDNNIKQILQLYAGINERAEKYENMMSKDSGEDMPGAADVVHCYNILLKGTALTGNIFNSLRTIAMKGINEYCNVVNKIMKAIGADSQPASAAAGMQ